jgi:3D (Asp-Asp-Asp) domain-containing protein
VYLSILAAIVVITMSVTAYVPDAGGINGNGRVMADGTAPVMGYAACGHKYPFGTVFQIEQDVSEFGLPQVVECRDRGGYIGPSNLDIVIKTGNVKEDLRLAREWGKRKIKVRVWASREAYNTHLRESALAVSPKESFE